MDNNSIFWMIKWGIFDRWSTAWSDVIMTPLLFYVDLVCWKTCAPRHVSFIYWLFTKQIYTNRLPETNFYVTFLLRINVFIILEVIQRRSQEVICKLIEIPLIFLLIYNIYFMQTRDEKRQVHLQSVNHIVLTITNIS